MEARTSQLSSIKLFMRSFLPRTVEDSAKPSKIAEFDHRRERRRWWLQCRNFLDDPWSVWSTDDDCRYLHFRHFLRYYCYYNGRLNDVYWRGNIPDRARVDILQFPILDSSSKNGSSNANFLLTRRHDEWTNCNDPEHRQGDINGSVLSPGEWQMRQRGTLLDDVDDKLHFET
uniref:Uncharacterized protein n=1 Tax=Romanomermis culicivorax TaxID=13658 RepID=A0A915I367_ROMCU